MTQLEKNCGVCFDKNLNDYRIIGFLVLGLCTTLVGGGVKYVSAVSPFVLVPVLASILLIWIGTWTAGLRDLDPSTGISAHWDLGKNWGEAWSSDAKCLTILNDDGSKMFTADDFPAFDFFQSLALFFPSVMLAPHT